MSGPRLRAIFAPFSSTTSLLFRRVLEHLEARNFARSLLPLRVERSRGASLANVDGCDRVFLLGHSPITCVDGRRDHIGPTVLADVGARMLLSALTSTKIFKKQLHDDGSIIDR